MIKRLSIVLVMLFLLTLPFTAYSVYGVKGIRSLKIDKPGITVDWVGWKSGNHAQTYWNHMEAGLYHIGGYIKTEGVNTSPADSTYEVGFYWEFYSGAALIAEVWIPADQSVATKDWDTVDSYVALPSFPTSVYCSFLFGPNATGIAWGDNFILGSDPWTAGFFGGSCETPTGWMEWHSTGEVGLAQYTDETAYSGTYSAKLMDLDDLSDEIVFYTIPYACAPDQLYMFSAMTKKVDIEPTDPHYLPVSWNLTRDNDRIGFTVGFHGTPIGTAWNWLGDNFFYIDQVDSMSDWEKTLVVGTSPSDAAGVSMRARFTSFPQGVVFYDDFSAQSIDLGANIIGNSDLETDEPFFWYPYPASPGATLTWATDEAYGDVRSLKIEKASTSAGWEGWVTGNQAQTYWNSMDAVLYHIGGYIKTYGVNTSPADSTYMIGLYWEFLSGGTQIAWEFIPADQSVATKDWDTVESYVALPSVPDSVYCAFVFGPNATGIAWGDNFILGSDPWTAGFFGGNCETPTGWMEWHSTGEVGVAEYTDEEAHSGTWSAKLEDLDALSDEIVFYTIPYACNPNTMYHFSAWVKKVDIEPTDPHYLPVNWNLTRDNDRIGFTVGFHGTPIDVAWNWLGDNFFYMDQVEANEDTTAYPGGWRKYEVVAMSPADAAGVSMRARFTSFPQGTVYFDDFEIKEITTIGSNLFANADLETYEPFWWYQTGTGATLTWDDTYSQGIEEEIVTHYELMQNYPNPFVNETYISYQLPKDTRVNLVIYDMLGRKVITLIDKKQLAGPYTIRWDGRNELSNRVVSGIYFYRLSTNEFQATQKMLILR